MIITAFEHQRLRVAAMPGDGGAVLSRDQAAKLASVSHRLPRGAVRWEGPGTVVFGQFCGLLPLGDDVIEILPKVERYSANRATSRIALMAMIAYCGDLDVSLIDAAHVGVQESLRDLIVVLFCREALSAVRRGLIRQYLDRQDDLTAVRGRIAVVRMAALGPARRHELPCDYDDLSQDNPFNRMVKAAARAAAPRAQSFEARRLARQLLFVLDEVTDVRMSASEAEQLPRNRLTARYERLQRLCVWMLRALAPDVRGGSHAGWGLLFDMNKLFQEYAFRMLRRACAALNRECSVTSEQPKRELMIAVPDGRKCFWLAPDVVVRGADGGTLAIIDAKWKLPDNAESNSGVEQGDVYQVLAYARRYGSPRAALAYPAHAGWSPGNCSWESAGPDPALALRAHAVTLPTPGAVLDRGWAQNLAAWALGQAAQ